MAQQVSFSQLSQLRRNAKRLARDKNLTHSQALDQVAQSAGFGNWSQLMKHAEQDATTAAGALAVSEAPAPRRFSPLEIQQMMGMPKLVATRDERKLIQTIVLRYTEIVGPERSVDVLSALMDLEACHCNGCPLDLVELASAPREEDVIHDVAGIARHLNRDTGKLEGHFWPRYSVQDVVTKTATA
jgi:hypothetical protein